jgi:hypothetical protein
LNHTAKHPTAIDGIWHEICFYETNDDSTVMYTARIDESNERLEWALHKTSATNLAKQVRCGWFYLPKMQGYIYIYISRS